MRRPPALLAAVVVPGLMLAGCGGGGQSADGGDGTTVVTSTNVYASIVEAVAGDAVDVRPIIDDPAQDPHEYEATARDQLELSRADLVVMNGGGYDSFVTTMLEAIDTDPDVIDTVAISGLPGAAEAAANGHSHDHSHDDGDEGDHGGDNGDEDGADQEGHDDEDEDEKDGTSDDEDEGGHAGDDEHSHDHGTFNEHVWYSVQTMLALVDEVETHLAEVVPESAQQFETNAEELREELEALQTRIDGIAEAHSGERAAVTEPVALRLFEDMGLENVVPDDFVSAVEAGSDVSPLVVAEATEAVDDEVRVFAYNVQTSGPEAEALRTSAEEQGIAVVEVAETMPEDTDYVTWMTDTVDTVEQALL